MLRTRRLRGLIACQDLIFESRYIYIEQEECAGSVFFAFIHILQSVNVDPFSEEVHLQRHKCNPSYINNVSIKIERNYLQLE